MRIISTIVLVLLAALCVTAATFLAIDGNIARLTGWYHFKPGMPLFSKENTTKLQDVSWMRIESLHDRIECAKQADGSWWITKPFHDRMQADDWDLNFHHLFQNFRLPPPQNDPIRFLIQ